MTDEELASIRRRDAATGTMIDRDDVPPTSWRDRRALLAEVDRLRELKSNVECNFVQHVLDSNLELAALKAEVDRLRAQVARVETLQPVHIELWSGRSEDVVAWVDLRAALDETEPARG